MYTVVFDLTDLIPEAIPSQKCLSIGPVLKGYGFIIT
jgi:hypothetical protein